MTDVRLRGLLACGIGAIVVAACGDDTGGGSEPDAAAGAAGFSSGGVGPASGGTFSMGGRIGSGGVTATGGSLGSGGAVASGGAAASGGAPTDGGVSGSGGASDDGGVVDAGGEADAAGDATTGIDASGDAGGDTGMADGALESGASDAPFSSDAEAGAIDASEGGDDADPLVLSGDLSADDPGRYSDGTFASTCSGYREPSEGYPEASTSGVYTIDRGGEGGAPISVYCDMTTDGGGWTLAFLKNSAHEGSYPDFCAADTNVAELAMSPSDASSSSDGHAGWLDLNSFDYDTLRLAAYADGAEEYTSDDIARSDLRIAFGEDGYFLYDDEDDSGYYWCGGSASYTDGGSGQVNAPSGAPSDCKGHGSLGSGWDFSDATGYNQGLTLCGTDASSRWMYDGYGPSSSQITYPNPGAAYAIWVRTAP